jgi:hypothetical protein
MSSEARQIANAANAQLSTGPRTDQGKARSSQNARTHGLTASQLFIPAEDREEFDKLHDELLADIRPQGAIQETLFEQVIDSAWNLRCIRRMQAQLNASAPGPDSLDDPVLTKKLDRLARHKTSNERSYHRALRELKSLQTDAALALLLPPEFIRRTQPLASKTKITKRTQALALADRRNGVEIEWWSGADAEGGALRFALENYDRPETPAAGK